ncbi:MAG: adenylosuccinate synthase [Candidatus Omnitrophica bacterium]|nr:adenylosuccinate synthase [Candidatus Omnitrophota bacterium]
MRKNKNHNVVLVGAQWGDEGKGKIIDLLAQKSDYIVRYQGGNNAGHTVCFDNEKIVLHLIPSGILHPKKICVIGNGVVIDLEAFFEEIKMLAQNGVSVKGRLFVSDRAHVIFPYHKLIDQLREDEKGSKKIGTTKKGIGPCYADKANRLGIRVVDLMNPHVFRERLKIVLAEKNLMLKKIFNHAPFSFDEIHRTYSRLRKRIAPYVRNTSLLLDQAARSGKKILFEGAQGTLLDVDYGTYPYVTSSNASAGGAIIGTGMSAARIDEVIGVVKAYTTRVGEGPFPTEFPPQLMAHIRERGEEYGATTGRPRRCGWFDALVTRHSVLVNGLSEIVVMKLDVLDDLPKIKICVAYKFRGRRYRDFPSDIEVLEGARPIYEEHPGWQSSTKFAKKWSELPPNARKYLKRLEQLLQVPISIVSVGSERSQTIFINGRYQ